MMGRSFDPPVSTSNLYAPDIDRVSKIFAGAFDRDGRLLSGHLVDQLETRLCGYHQSKYCVAFSTGFWALVAAVRSKSLSGKSQVIMPSFTYRRLADVVFWADKMPVMVDIDLETLAIAPDAVKANITEQTALILAVHPIVNCCDVDALIAVATECQIPIVFDAVESVHETISGRRVGSWGVGEVFSFHASKLINGVEGGYVCTDDQPLRNTLVAFRSGQLGEASSIGIHSIMNDGHAAFALAGLDELEINVQHNRQIYQRYEAQLSTIPGILILKFDQNEQSSFKNVVAEVTDRFPISRDALVANLNEHGILARAHYSPALHTKSYRYAVETTAMPNTESIMTRLINLPCGQRVTKQDVDGVCRFIDSLARQANDE
ncbi:DegT/DnrJ/EryC1/StrS family aminotransferase [Planctomycetes bacterium K23_9]|uniref:UDP-4-amino-4-deoxy-L-arabinose--oxoglutarate aminotransferase n=1 Tax=Stieleria marina TaxID=1930275 RepID=A0A517P2E8_9BACT|nr:UDP-4-amino-4-deoxy-L-arabinose--oxoglutarate aminotransferase [Planctomycetes bacterium K23_9]